MPGIVLCFMQSAMFSGLTLGLFGLGRLQLEIRAESGDKAAIRVLALRKDANLLLTTLLWGNVSVNCLLTLLSDSIMTGVVAFVFSTVGITLFGEIVPQAYFSRNALQMGAFFAPVVRLYQKLFYILAKPSAMLLDWWLGPEGITYFQEKSFKIMLEKHMSAKSSDIGKTEGRGALNFLSLDDLKVSQEGEIVDPMSVIPLPSILDLPVFPEMERIPTDPFLQKIQISEKKWIILTDMEGHPKLVLDSDAFLRDALYKKEPFRPYAYCHRPHLVTDPNVNLGDLLPKLRVNPEHSEDDVIDHDLILYWRGDEHRIITGADLLGRLLRGIATVRQQDPIAAQEAPIPRVS